MTIDIKPKETLIIRPKIYVFVTLVQGKCTYYYMYINQQDAQNSVIRLYFPLDALHVPDYISPSGATFISCISHLVYADTIRVAVVWLKFCD